MLRHSIKSKIIYNKKLFNLERTSSTNRPNHKLSTNNDNVVEKVKEDEQILNVLTCTSSRKSQSEEQIKENENCNII